MKIIVVGPGGVGKTACCLALVKRFFVDGLRMPIGVEFHVHRCTIDEKEFVAQLWDLAGQDAFGFIRAHYYKGALGLLTVSVSLRSF